MCPVRKQEGLPEEIVLMHGTVPEAIEVREGAVATSPRRGMARRPAPSWTSGRTACWRAAAGPPGGTALDCFSYHGSFALHLATRAGRVAALDASREALARGTENAVLNGIDNIDWVEGDAFEALRDVGARRPALRHGGGGPARLRQAPRGAGAGVAGVL